MDGRGIKVVYGVPMGSGATPPNSSEATDPLGVHILSELAAALNDLRGALSYSDLDRAAGGHGQKRAAGSRLKSSTLSDLLNGQSVPSIATLTLFLSACGLPEPEHRPWLAALERVGTSHLHRPEGAVRVREAKARRLGVHASIQIEPGAETLPPYIPRDLDAELRTVVAAAAADGGMVVLTGSSSVGKTRALFEAVRAAVPEWWLVHPADAPAVRALAERPSPRTVVWVDELQRYMDQPGGLPAAAVRRLLDAGMLVVGTLWPEDYATRTALRVDGQSDPQAEDRALLGLARVIDVAAAFTPTERQRAEMLVSDPRIELALSSMTVGVTQVLAAGPELIRRWENAPAGHSYGQAVITAALDARRVGAHAPLTADFLSAAAQSYLSTSRRALAPPDWFNQAIRYATQPVHGAAACLEPVAAGMGKVAGYVTADYLHQHARASRRTVAVPDAVWRALVDHHQADDLFRIASNAERRGRSSEAIALYRRFAQTEAESHSVAVEVADVLVAANQTDEALAVLRPQGHIERGSVAHLATVLTEHGRVDEAVAALRIQADEGNEMAAQCLAQLLAAERRLDELKERADAGDSAAAWRLAFVLTADGHADQAIAVMPQEFSDERAACRLSKLLIEGGRVNDALAILRQAASAGGRNATVMLAGQLVAQNRTDEAIGFLRPVADSGEPLAAFHLADLLASQARKAELRKRADAGDHLAAERLAELLVEEEAITLLEAHAVDGGSAIAIPLGRLLTRQGRPEDAVTVLAAADNGDRRVSDALARQLRSLRRIDDLRGRAESGDWPATDHLSRWLAANGKSDEAISLLRRRADAGEVLAVQRLAEHLLEDGDVDGAVTMLRRAADAGDEFAGRRLVEILVRHERLNELEGEVAAGTPGAAARLLRSGTQGSVR